MTDFERIRELLRILLGPQRLGTGAIRIEDWSEWPEEQRVAYEQLRALAGFSGSAFPPKPPSD